MHLNAKINGGGHIFIRLYIAQKTWDINTLGHGILVILSIVTQLDSRNMGLQIARYESNQSNMVLTE